MNDLLKFLKSIKANNGHFFVEAEAKPTRMQKFISDYNRNCFSAINMHSDGIIVLQEDANKWGLELRLYVAVKPPSNVSGFTKNDKYKGEYSHRLNDNDVVEILFKNGYKIGLN